MTGFLSLAMCPFCGAAGNLWLFFCILGAFILMFGGTICMFIGSWIRGEWSDQDLRWSAVRAEGLAPEDNKSTTEERP